MTKSEYVYTTYIKTTPEKLWDALTNPEFIKQYWFGALCESDWKAGSEPIKIAPTNQPDVAIVGSDQNLDQSKVLSTKSLAVDAGIPSSLPIAATGTP